MANGVVYVGSWNGNVYALNAGTGALLWEYTTGSNVYSSPAVANGVVYIGSVARQQSVRLERRAREHSCGSTRTGALCLFFAGGGQRRGVRRVCGQ